MRCELVVDAVARHERNLRAADRTDRDGRARGTERRVDVDVLDVVEERVEPGTAEDPDGRASSQRAQADFVAGLLSDLLDDPDDPDDPDEEPELDPESEELEEPELEELDDSLFSDFSDFSDLLPARFDDERLSVL
jgi:hypothetical protein